jgi:hypothetical protein
MHTQEQEIPKHFIYIHIAEASFAVLRTKRSGQQTNKQKTNKKTHYN